MLIKLRNTRRLIKRGTKGGILFLFGGVDHQWSMTDSVQLAAPAVLYGSKGLARRIIGPRMAAQSRSCAG